MGISWVNIDTTPKYYWRKLIVYNSGNGENYKEAGTTNADKLWEVDAYPELVVALRTALGPDKTICAALPGVPRDMIAFDAKNLAKIIPYMDFFNIMTYDLINRRDTALKHHAGIEDSLIAVETYLGNGMPREKTILGFAFYLKWFKTLPLKDHSGPTGGPSHGRRLGWNWCSTLV